MIVIGGTIESDPVQDTYDPLPWEGTWRGSNGYYDDAVHTLSGNPMSWTGVSNSYQGGATFSLSYNEDTKVITMTETRSQDASKYVSTISTTGMTHSTNTMTVNGPTPGTSSTLTRVYVPHHWEGTWKDETGGFFGGTEQVLGVRARSARIWIISLSHVSIMSLKLQESHS